MSSAFSRIAVFGGTGFVGRHLVARLARDGHALRVVTRAPARHRELKVLPGVELRQADVFNDGALAQAVAGCDAVINLVGILNEGRGAARSFDQVHMQLPARIARVARRFDVRRFMHMSALGVHAEAPSRYLRSKAAGELAVRNVLGDAVDCAFLRPSVIFGADDSFINCFAGLLALAPGFVPLAAADAQFAPVHVRDVVEAFARVLGGPPARGAAFELCGPQRFTLAEIVAAIAAAAGLRRRIIALPRPLARVQAALMQWLPGKPFTPDNLRSLSVPSVCADNSCARLGIVPTALAVVLAERFGAGQPARTFDRLRRRYPGA